LYYQSQSLTTLKSDTQGTNELEALEAESSEVDLPPGKRQNTLNEFEYEEEEDDEIEPVEVTERVNENERVDLTFIHETTVSFRKFEGRYVLIVGIIQVLF